MVFGKAEATVGEIEGKGLGWTAWLLNRTVASFDEAIIRDSLEQWVREPDFTYMGNLSSASTALIDDEQRKRRVKYSVRAFGFAISMLSANLGSASSNLFKVASAVYSIAFIADVGFAKMVPSWDSTMVYISSFLQVLASYFLLVSSNKVHSLLSHSIEALKLCLID
ncbi:hypothetical protein BAE44_0016838 [Dichanthelium oligosanthes]|uniref:Uncharacterized protein n=1 Tax=Dichanthelium oligosanthes TaxID=888268 RepID=A0A1E5VAV1_9POAL|nr:hypothetical protein BAE44_0016838 [Dichanthelium oligosanthes]